MEGFPLHALLAGIGSGVLFIAGVASLVGPVASDSPSEMASALASGRIWALVALIGAGLSAMLSIWFFSVLRSWLRSTTPSGDEELGTATFAAGVLASGLALIGMSFFYGATYSLAEQGGSDAVRGLVDAANAVMMLTKFPGAMVVLMVSIAMSRSGFPAWFANLGYASVAILLVSAIGLFTTDSFTEFGGPLDFYATFPAAIWGVLLMIFLYRARPSTAPSAR